MSLFSQNKVKEVYEVQKGETLESIANRYNVSVAELKLVNPDIKNKKDSYQFKRGYLLNIPAHDNASENFRQNTSSLTPNYPDAIDTIKIAVMLPFSGKGAIAERVLEYYRGLLIAGFAARESGYVAVINAIEEPKQNVSSLDSLVKLCAVKPDFLIAPLYPSHFAEVSEFAKNEGIRTLIPFSSRTNEVMNNPLIYVLNTPNNIVIDKAKVVFDKTFKKSSQIVVVRTSNPNKIDFIKNLHTHWSANNHIVNTLPNRYLSEDLVRVFNKNKQNIVILDGTNKKDAIYTLNAISEFKMQNPEYKVCVLGYGEWQDFSMEESDLLFNADTYLFSSDYYNAYNSGVIKFEERYKYWFGQYPLIYHPRMGELGYDSGIYMLNAIAIYGKKYVNQPFNADYLQSNLKFDRINNNGGYVNTSLIFIHYNENQKIEIINS
ncbi:MAG: LysM peptidoglycan-binding domain-containing protein [Bacteroidaceae bacterium]|nr:LysM peptidoglycan-binding domain-containing protein [Bacteroidaceae bacterium]